MKTARELSVVGLTFVVVFGGKLARAEALTTPMRARNLSPPIAIFGVPAWDRGLDPGRSGRFSLSGDIASHFRFAAAGSEMLILDGETWRVDAVFERRLTDDWTFGVELPIVRVSGGVLDNVIDAWHSVFSLPDGRRNTRPEDELQFFYDGGPGPGYFRSEPDTGIGDIVLSVARTVGAQRPWLVSFALKLPTGDKEMLAGSGAADLGVSVLRRNTTRWKSRPFAWYWGVSLLALGEQEALPVRNKDRVGLAVAGVSWQAFRTLGFKAQLDAHSAFYESALEEIGDPAVQATLGGWWSIDERRTLTVAVIEDLITRAAPDVSIHVGLAWNF